VAEKNEKRVLLNMNKELEINNLMKQYINIVNAVLVK